MLICSSECGDPKKPEEGSPGTRVTVSCKPAPLKEPSLSFPLKVYSIESDYVLTALCV